MEANSFGRYCLFGLIEIAQPVFGRAFDINDIILNTVGVLISATVFSFVKGIIEKRKKA